MSKYQLNIYHLTHKESVKLIDGQPYIIKTLSNHQYQIIDENGKLIALDAIPNTQLVGNDLYIYLEGATEPNLILQDYALYSSIDNAQLLTQVNTTFATVESNKLLELPILASEVIEVGASSNSIWISSLVLGAAALGGTLSFANTNNGRGSQSSNVNKGTNKAEPDDDKDSISNAREQMYLDKLNLELNKLEELHQQYKNALSQATNPLDVEGIDAINAAVEAIITQQDKVKDIMATLDTELGVTESDKAHKASSEKRIEVVGTPEKVVAVSIDTIGQNNVVNKNYAAQAQTLTGTVTAETGSEVKVNVVINGQTYPAQVQDNQWSVVLPENVLAYAEGDQSISVNVEATKNGLTAKQTLEKAYFVDTVLEDPIIELNNIATDNIIQYVESKQATTVISGKVTNSDRSAAKAGDIVEISAGTTRVSVPLEEKEGELVFSAPIGTVALINHAAEGLSLSLVSTDAANNTKTTTKQQSYSVNLERDIQVGITSIAGDDMLNKAESTANVDIVGRVTNGEKDETVEIWCSCAICNTGWKLVESVMLAENGDFSLSVNGAVLNETLPNGEKPKIKAVYKTKAETQLTNTAKVEDSREYTVDVDLTKPVTTPPKLKVNGSGVTISGELDRIDADVKNSDVKVTVTVDDKAYEATVSEDKRSWTLEQPNTELLSFENKKVVAKVNVTDKAGNTNESDEKEAELLPKIDITAIGENFSVDNTGELITISGEIVYKDLFARGKNAAQVRLVKVRIGEKVYEVPLNADWKTFDLKLPLADAQALNGKAISIEFNRVQVFSPKTNDDGSIGFNNHNNQTVATESITLKSDYITPNAANNGYNLTIKAPSSVISGKVMGDNIVGGEKVTITVGNKVFNDVVVEPDKTFRLEVENKILAEAGDKKVTATLSTTNLAGNQIEVSDVEHYTATAQVGGTYGQALHADVEGNARKFNHQSDEFNFPYFMDPFYSAKLGTMGYHRVPFGGLGDTPVIKYHFATKEELAIHDPNANKPLNISTQQKDAFRKAYQYIEKFTNLKFEEVDHYITDRTGTNIFAKVHNGGGAAYASVGDGSWIWVNSAYGNENGSTTSAGIANLYNNVLNYVYYASMHEVLHTLGFNHSNTIFTNANRTGKFGGMGAGAAEDTTEFTYMSYNGLFGTKGSYLPFYDLAALHYRYGVNKTVRTGNDVYGFQNYRDVNSDGNGVYIWDGGGVDTFDASEEKQRVHINLKPGSWNYRGDAAEKMMTIKSSTAYNAVQFFSDEIAQDATPGKASNGRIDTRSITEYVEGQSFIGFGTQIENAIGSAYNDTLLGNDVANNLIGNGGNDLIKGSKGNDYLNGGAGDDEMHGGEDNDTYVVDSEQDQVIELDGQGTDTVFSTVNFTLKDHVEHLTLLGTTAKTATGNNLANTLTANNVGNTLSGLDDDDILIGGLEIDTLIGGAGSDTFVFNTELNGNVDIIKDFEDNDKIELARAIFSEIENAEQVFNFITFNSATGELSYKANAGADAIHFATLENFYTNLEQQHFSIV